jgi:hypothetical protein
MLYAQVVWELSQYYAVVIAGQSFQDHKLSWERADQGFEAILKQFPDSLNAKNARAYLAFVAGEKDRARSYFLATGGNVVLDQWDNGDGFDNFLKSAFAR